MKQTLISLTFQAVKLLFGDVRTRGANQCVSKTIIRHELLKKTKNSKIKCNSPLSLRTLNLPTPCKPNGVCQVSANVYTSLNGQVDNSSKSTSVQFKVWRN